MKKFFLLVVSCLFFSCGKTDEVPEGLLTQEQMIELMIDIRIAEGEVMNLLLTKDSAQSLFKTLEDKIFEENNIDTAYYKSSYQYYLLHPEEGALIYSAVLDSINLMKEKISSGN